VLEARLDVGEGGEELGRDAGVVRDPLERGDER
jgi:hypothetical protein